MSALDGGEDGSNFILNNYSVFDFVCESMIEGVLRRRGLETRIRMQCGLRRVQLW